MANAFFAASRNGDTTALRALFTEDVFAIADGGGRVAASPLPLVGLDAVLLRHAEMARDFALRPSQLVRYGMIDGLPGFITVEDGGLVQTTALQVRGDRIVGIYVTRNREKLRHLSGTPDHSA